MQGKYKIGKIGEVYIWIWNKLIVLKYNFVLIQLPQTKSWIEIGRYVLMLYTF